MNRKVVVFNPNCSMEVSDRIRAVASKMGVESEVVTDARGPETVSTDLEVAEAGERFSDFLKQRASGDVFMVGCFADPGLENARQATDRPVIGIQQAAIHAALAIGDKFGIIALSESAIRRHTANIAKMNLTDRFAGELALPNLSAFSSGGAAVVDSMADIAAELSRAGADSVILGCAGMSPIKRVVEEKAGVRIIDPVATGLGLAMSLKA